MRNYIKFVDPNIHLDEWFLDTFDFLDSNISKSRE